MSKAQAQPQMQMAEVVQEIVKPNGDELKAMAARPPQAVTPMALIEIAVNQNADIAKLEKLFDLQLRWEANEAKKAYVKAMNLFKSEPLEILKNKHVDYTTRTGVHVAYDHATLDEVCRQVVPAMSKHGLSHRWNLQQGEGLIRVSCIVTHEMGYSEETTLSGGADDSGGKNSIQAIKSAVTYLERTTLLAAIGMAEKNGDNDGASTPEMAGLDRLLEDIKQSPTLVALKARFEKAFKDATHANNPPALKAILMAKDERKKELETAQ